MWHREHYGTYCHPLPILHNHLIEVLFDKHFGYPLCGPHRGERTSFSDRPLSPFRRNLADSLRSSKVSSRHQHVVVCCKMCRIALCGINYLSALYLPLWAVPCSLISSTKESATLTGPPTVSASSSEASIVTLFSQGLV